MSNKVRVNKRTQSTKKYLDELNKVYSKLNVVRLDLSYKKPYSNKMTLEETNKDIQHMFNNMRSKPSVYGDKVGYMLKKEYTEDKGMHIHAVFFFDGQKIKKSAYKADQIGEHWEEITQEKGAYHNCHRNKYKHKGVGILKHDDIEKRKILDQYVISYLCKDDSKQDIESIRNSKRAKAFVRGAMPKKKNNVGRPRKDTNTL
ncbi:inovirus Gp2 family protein [Sulfurimonas sp. SWIR-19]|uniref:YagK/YfjJ domain-containing protein n=1 Tax=Sulfurimonas sp. SWIR-19 TaxID=2878390 RepID=UPI001CF57DCF|nr:inovirus-type Gp2 protein [Sulfurimonas sp. SWIR-19]UCN00136.1 inovirus Gp2 family protein [Sulfurimonas sp. SWIR-19]